MEELRDRNTFPSPFLLSSKHDLCENIKFIDIDSGLTSSSKFFSRVFSAQHTFVHVVMRELSMSQGMKLEAFRANSKFYYFTN